MIFIGESIGRSTSLETNDGMLKEIRPGWPALAVLSVVVVVLSIEICHC